MLIDYCLTYSEKFSTQLHDESKLTKGYVGINGGTWMGTRANGHRKGGHMDRVGKMCLVTNENSNKLSKYQNIMAAVTMDGTYITVIPLF